MNVSGIARDCGVARTTVDGYLEILEETPPTFRLPAFEARLRVRERHHPKLYWVDPGLVRAAKRQLSEPVAVEERGPLFEGLVLHLLRATARSRRSSTRSSNWAPTQAAQTEVDFLLAAGPGVPGGGGEVPGPLRDVDGGRPSGRSASSPGVVRRVLVYRGTRSLKTEDGIEVWPLERFDATVAASRLWP